jgi:hypothetical protein
LLHRIYSGSTGVLWNVTLQAAGVFIYFNVNNHIALKCTHVQTYHISYSKRRDEFLKLVQVNQRAQIESKKSGIKLGKPLKHLPEQPREAYVVNPETLHSISVAPYNEN